MRRVVVLPQPDGPTRTINSRSAISRSIPCTAGVLSNILTMLRSATCAILSVLSCSSPLLRRSRAKDVVITGNAEINRSVAASLPGSEPGSEPSPPMAATARPAANGVRRRSRQRSGRRRDLRLLAGFRLLRPDGRVTAGRAEDARVVWSRAAMALELMGVAAQRVGLAQIADDPAAFAVVDHRQRLLRRVAEAVERGAQTVAG